MTHPVKSPSDPNPAGLVAEHVRPVRDSGERVSDSELAERAVSLAEAVLIAAENVRTASERRQSEKIARMMNDPSGKSLTLALADRLFRPPTAKRAAIEFRRLIEDHGIPGYTLMCRAGEAALAALHATVQGFRFSVYIGNYAIRYFFPRHVFIRQKIRFFGYTQCVHTSHNFAKTNMTLTQSNPIKKMVSTIFMQKTSDLLGGYPLKSEYPALFLSGPQKPG